MPTSFAWPLLFKHDSSSVHTAPFLFAHSLSNPSHSDTANITRHHAVAMILHAGRMLIPNVMIFRLAIGIVHPDSWMTSHADKTINVIGVMTRPDIIEIHLGYGRILHTNGVTSTTTHAKPSFKSEGDHAQDARHEHEHDRPSGSGSSGPLCFLLLS